MFLSSAADNMNMVMAMSRGADDFIAKPFDLDVLTAKVQAVLPQNLCLWSEQQSSGKGRRSAESWKWDDFSGWKACRPTKNELKILQILFEHRGACCIQRVDYDKTVGERQLCG